MMKFIIYCCLAYRNPKTIINPVSTRKMCINHYQDSCNACKTVTCYSYQIEVKKLKWATTGKYHNFRACESHNPSIDGWWTH